jgi:hypothetical protein
MRKFKEMKRPRLATIVAALALVIALGGTATAAGLINGKKIKNNTITGKKLRNKTITKKKIAPATIKALKGQKGPKGDTGAKGDKGEAGKNGVVAPTYEEFNSINIPDGADLALGTVNVPAGKYMINAVANAFASNDGRMECYVTTNNGGSSETSSWDSPGANFRNALPLTYVTTTATVTSITLGCGMTDASGSAGGSITVTPVQ